MPTGLEDIRMPQEGEPERKTALVVAAHPDDSEFGVGGTAALWSQQEWDFYYLICTDGSKGSEEPDMTAEKLVPMRREEQRGAAQVLGVKDVFFLDYVDGDLRYSPDLMRDVVRFIRRIKPYAVFTHDPNQIVRNVFINHPDHRCAGETALDAVYPIARNRPSFPELIAEGLEPYSTKEVYLWSASETNFDVDISSTIDTKFEALRRHVSQMGDLAEREQGIRQFWREEDGRYLEKFRRIIIPF
jgi:LmbE family N-acetylglucosaminyl deacetylase